MSFKRVLLPATLLQGEALTAALLSLGFRLGGEPSSSLHSFNIEDTLLAASIEGCLKPDYRVLSLLVDWISIHSHAVNVDRMARVILTLENQRVRAFWIAVARWQKIDSRWKKISKLRVAGRVDLLEVGTDFLISKHGEDDRFKGTCLRVPKLTLRERKEDILTPEALARRHKGYYYRILIGPTYRADMWAYLDERPTAATAEIARAAYGSFTTAWEVKRDWAVLSSRINCLSLGR